MIEIKDFLILYEYIQVKFEDNNHVYCNLYLIMCVQNNIKRFFLGFFNHQNNLIVVFIDTQNRG